MRDLDEMRKTLDEVGSRLASVRVTAGELVEAVEEPDKNSARENVETIVKALVTHQPPSPN